MDKKVYILGAALLLSVKCSVASDQVWRYVDERTGQVSYSNVPIKGRKGERLEIMAYPTLASPSSGPAIGAPIPAEVLRQLQGTEARPAKPPSGLPPLPSLPGGSAKGSVEGISATPASADGASEPKWAKEVPVQAGVAPSWAQDPFSHK